MSCFLALKPQGKYHESCCNTCYFPSFIAEVRDQLIQIAVICDSYHSGKIIGGEKIQVSFIDSENMLGCLCPSNISRG